MVAGREAGQAMSGAPLPSRPPAHQCMAGITSQSLGRLLASLQGLLPSLQASASGCTPSTATTMRLHGVHCLPVRPFLSHRASCNMLGCGVAIRVWHQACHRPCHRPCLKSASSEAHAAFFSLQQCLLHQVWCSISSPCYTCMSWPSVPLQAVIHSMQEPHRTCLQGTWC